MNRYAISSATPLGKIETQPDLANYETGAILLWSRYIRRTAYANAIDGIKGQGFLSFSS